ncbi:LOW QUALITY PROTEIN: prospero homeobox protein 2-like [Acanthochromis polyacanthus]|uniref:LOW QUALITY PROTEIN: prospero homeobox protein 2-like n=1 Tax=Acanthochromis polyacanthus TaxID=80966 RepID=UPI002234D30E|nr:LOW QUALITY PROTEIN: prospero homeobox protein 2-like [Acanthochromis polyacanthus]
MNQSVWSKGMFSSSSICLDGCTAEHLSSFQPSHSEALSVSTTFHRDSKTMKTLPDSSYYSSGDTASGLICSSRDDTAGHLPNSYLHPDWNLNSGRQAKRARVENIIKGMTGSPGLCCSGVTTDQDCVQEEETIEELPLNLKHLDRSGSSQSRAARKQNLRQLRTRFNHTDEGSETTDSSKEEKYPRDSPETSPSDAFTDPYCEFENRKHQGWKKVKLMSYFQSKPERIKLMADVLKHELSRAVSRSVDSIFTSMPLLQTNDVENVETDTDLQSSTCRDSKLPCCGATEVPDVQTEALSLVVRKPNVETSNKFVLQSRLKPHHHPKSPNTFSHDSARREDQVSEKNHRCLPEVVQSKFEAFDAHWNSVKVRSKVNSRSVRSPQIHTVSVDPMLLESLCLPHVKTESDSLVKNNLCMLNEGLTTNHLKKAKLMFFYTRYPSSLVLKMCFHDVQFTRCITSQLIKWFSNFREFYYIQMEKFARHALMEGVVDVQRLAVGRESELFRALNMHYNKANDFQISCGFTGSERFLEVAEITLREFYVAISMGKDENPSWKKAIYKVICKLDSDVPAEFKSQHAG